MLIIFDLDDTLIDTSGTITPYQLQRALRFLMSDSIEHLEELLECNRVAATSREALITLARRYQVGAQALERAFLALKQPLPEKFPIALTSGAQEILSLLSHSASFLALVTSGDPPFQMEKLEKSGIDPSLFSNMAVPEGRSKGPYYRALSQAFSTSPREVWVVGDRPPIDLRPAHELGFRTLWRRWGRGLHETGEPWIDGEIFDLRDMVYFMKEDT